MTDRDGIGECTVREARQDDTELVERLYSQMAPDVSNVDRDFRAMLADPRAICRILEASGEPVGMVIAYVRSTLSSGRKMVIDELVVDREFRGKRLGSLLLDHSINDARVQALDCVELCCSLGNQEIQRFYEKAGFEHRMRLYSVFLD